MTRDPDRRGRVKWFPLWDDAMLYDHVLVMAYVSILIPAGTATLWRPINSPIVDRASKATTHRKEVYGMWRSLILADLKHHSSKKSPSTNLLDTQRADDDQAASATLSNACLVFLSFPPAIPTTA